MRWQGRMADEVAASRVMVGRATELLARTYKRNQDGKFASVGAGGGGRDLEKMSPEEITSNFGDPEDRVEIKDGPDVTFYDSGSIVVSFPNEDGSQDVFAAVDDRLARAMSRDLDWATNVSDNLDDYEDTDGDGYLAQLNQAGAITSVHPTGDVNMKWPADAGQTEYHEIDLSRDQAAAVSQALSQFAG